jgi:hypothetical protein
MKANPASLYSVSLFCERQSSRSRSLRLSTTVRIELKSSPITGIDAYTFRGANHFEVNAGSFCVLYRQSNRRLFSVAHSKFFSYASRTRCFRRPMKPYFPYR